MIKSAKSLDSALDQRLTRGRDHSVASGDVLLETCDLLQSHANTITPREEFSRSLRKRLASASLPGSPDTAPGLTTARSFLSSTPPSLIRRCFEVAAILLVLLAGIYVFTRHEQAPSSSNPTVSAGAKVVPAVLATRVLESGWQPNRIYDPTRIGAILTVNVDYAQLRDSPSFDGITLRLLVRGEKVVVQNSVAVMTSPESIFYDVESSDGVRGWIWYGAITLSTEEIVIQNSFTPAAEISGAKTGQNGFSPDRQPTYTKDTQLFVITSTPLRVEPGDSGYAIAELAVGDIVWSNGRQIETKSDTWIGVEYLGMGRTFWVEDSAVAAAGEVGANSGIEATVTPLVSMPEAMINPGAMPTRGELLRTTFEISLRADSSPDSVEVEILPAGTLLVVTGPAVSGPSDATWIPVLETETGENGWVPFAWVQSVPAESALVRVGAQLNVKLPYILRVDHSFRADAIAVLVPGEPFLVLQTDVFEDDVMWIRVRLSDGMIGWLTVVAADPELLFATPDPLEE